MDKELKLIILKDMLWRIETLNYIGFCAAFETALKSYDSPGNLGDDLIIFKTNNFEDYEIENFMLQNLPELQSYKPPKSLLIGFGFWFPKVEHEPNRIRILKEIIHKLEQET